MMRIERNTFFGGTEVAIESDGVRERLASIAVPFEASLPEAVSHLATQLGPDGERLVRLDGSGPVQLWTESMAALCRAFPALDVPLTWVDGAGDSAAQLPVTLRLDAVTRSPVESVVLDAGARARTYSDDCFDYCAVGNLLPEDSSAPPNRQAQSVFERLSRLLELGGWSLSDLVRTWFYLDRIWEWYGEFNSVRSQYFQAHGLFERDLPASTGVGAANPTRTALVASALAVRPRHAESSFRTVPSPLQCSPLEYGSSFSRAVAILRPSETRLMISGTASIAQDGRTVNPGDLDAQVAHTMQAVRALLGEHGLSSSDVTRAVAYFRHARDAQAWQQHPDLAELPVTATRCDICRPELLFEIEVDAAGARSRK